MCFQIACLATLSIVLSAILPAGAQRFYAVSPVYLPLGNKTLLLDIASCDSVSRHVCPPTHNLLQYFENVYGDMAIDGDSNVWYISSWGSLYKGSLHDTACSFVAKLESATVNALVADADGNLYAAGMMNGLSVLYKYDSTGFHVLGRFPPGIFSSGDLFFYENCLFMTCTDAHLTKTSLVEVSLPDPAGSCYYMSLGTGAAFGAFSIREGAESKAFVLLSVDGASSTLIEIDIPNRRLAGNICSYPFVVNGAAAPYDLTADSNTCIPLPPTAITAVRINDDFITVLQPSSGRIRVQSNIDAAQISCLTLFELSGRKVKSFDPSAFPHDMDVSALPDGMYILNLSTSNGQVHRQKMLKTGTR